MFTQEEIDSVLSKAQSDVATLVDDVGVLASGSSSAPVQHTPPSAPSAARRPSGASMGRILRIRVPVVVRLAQRSMVLNEVMKLTPGTILEFDRTVDSELDLLVNNHPIGSGVAVKVNERFGLRINRIGNLAQRIASFGAAG